MKAIHQTLLPLHDKLSAKVNNVSVNHLYVYKRNLECFGTRSDISLSIIRRNQNGGRASAASLHHPSQITGLGMPISNGKNASDYSIPRSILSDLALAECESLYDTAALTSKQPWAHSFPGNLLLFLLLLLLLLYLIPVLERGGYLNFSSFFAVTMQRMERKD